ncbi:MAG: MFS transporter, partial [Thermomicrobiales bacterium]|nr:MFS transporter [Thermomicrobiales bacterium]
SLVRFSSDLGLVVGPYLTGALADAFGYGTPFIVLPAVMLAAAVVALRTIPRSA